MLLVLIALASKSSGGQGHLTWRRNRWLLSQQGWWWRMFQVKWWHASSWRWERGLFKELKDTECSERWAWRNKGSWMGVECLSSRSFWNVFKVFLSLDCKVQEGRNHVCPVHCCASIRSLRPMPGTRSALDNGLLHECITVNLSLPLWNLLCSSV